MIFEIIVLALASTIRPTSLAAVYALLAPDSRRTLLIAYVATGLVFTLGFGLLVVYAMHGVHFEAGSTTTKAIADLIGGGLCLTLAAAILTGRVRPQQQDAPRPPGRWASLTSSERLTPWTAAAAGPATHIPGLFYLIALNVIVSHDPHIAGGTLALAIYNAIWFAIPIAALCACFVRPDAARGIVGGIDAWARAHARAIMLSASLVVGLALVVRGAVGLWA